MGLFSKVKKAIKKSISSASGGLIGDEGKAPKEAPVAPVVQTATTEVAKKEPEEDSETDTAASGKAAKAKGKRNLSVARSQGTGVNL